MADLPEVELIRDVDLQGISSPKSNRQHVELGFLCGVLFCVSVAAAVLFKSIAIRMQEYPFVVTQSIPIVGILLYGSASLVLWLRGQLKPENMVFKKHKAVVIASLFALSNTLSDLGNRGNTVEGPLVLLTGKMLVPITMVLSAAYLKTRYTWLHLVAVLVLITGFVVAAWPAIKSEGVYAQSLMLLLLISLVPMAMAFVYLEEQLKRHDQSLCIPYLWMWICSFEAVIGFALAPLNAWIQGIAFDEIPANFYHGVLCLSGTSGDSLCSGALLMYLAWIPLNGMFNMCTALVVKRGSATLGWFIRAAVLPVATLFFCLRAIMGQFVSTLSIYHVIGLVFVLVGLVLYQVHAETRAGDDEEGCGCCADGTCSAHQHEENLLAHHGTDE